MHVKNVECLEVEVDERDVRVVTYLHLLFEALHTDRNSKPS